MSPQERDIRKLQDYASRLGLKVLRKPYNRFTGQAEYDDSRRTITLFGRSSTKTATILSLLHELGHALDYIKNKNTPQVNEAYGLLNKGPMVGARLDIPKKYRKTILQVEKNGIKYMTKIHKELGLEISLELVKKQQKIDLFDYEIFYKEARFPTYEETFRNLK